MPDLLYKYRSLATESNRRFSRAIFLEGTVYFAPPRALNDPFEGLFSVSFGSRSKTLSPEREQYAKNFLAYHMRETIGILCLTEKPDDVLMWSHYADSHRGICIGFRSSDKSSIFGKAKPVIYTAQLPKVEAGTPMGRETAERAALTKSPHWEYEQEWRVIDRENGSGPRSFPKNLIDRVILGSLITDDHRQLVQEWVGQLGHPVTIQQATLDRENYQISIREDTP